MVPDIGPDIDIDVDEQALAGPITSISTKSLLLLLSHQHPHRPQIHSRNPVAAPPVLSWALLVSLSSASSPSLLSRGTWGRTPLLSALDLHRNKDATGMLWPLGGMQGSTLAG